MPDYLDDQGNVVKQYLDDNGNPVSSEDKHPYLHAIKNWITEPFDPQKFMGMMDSAAHPKTVGDMLQLVIPSEIGNPVARVTSGASKLEQVPSVVKKLETVPKEAIDIPKLEPPKLLGPAPSQPKFISGEGGTAINKPYNYDMGVVNPKIGADQGTVLPQEFGEVNKVPPEIPASGMVPPKPIQTDPMSDYDYGYKKTDKGYYPAEVGARPGQPQLPTAEKPPISRFHEVAEHTHPNGDAPPLTDVTPITHPPEQDAIPAAGNARPIKDIDAFSANSGSADQILEKRELTKSIVNLVRDQGWDKMQEAIGTNIRKLDGITSGMNKQQLEAFGRTTENVATDTDKTLLSSIPNIEQKLTDYRTFMDQIYTDAKVVRGDKLGYTQDYFTHIEKEPEEFAAALKDIFGYRQGRDAIKGLFNKADIVEKSTGEAGGIYDKGMGEVGESGFVKPRTGALTNIDYNVNKVGRTYIESMARETYLRPQVQKAEELIKALPQSKLKELAESYIKNITGFSHSPQLNNDYKNFTRYIVDTTGKSMMSLNPHLQALHAMRLGPVYVDLGPKYSAIGLAKTLANPMGAYREAASLGMLPSELMPWSFQTTAEKVNSLGNFKSGIDFVDRSIAYKGAYARALDQGLSGAEAKTRAIVEAKKMTFMTDPARQSIGLNPEAKNVLGKLAAQYRQVPTKIMETIINTGQQYKDNPAAARRMLTLLGAAGTSYAVGGPSIFHMPLSLARDTIAGLTAPMRILSYAIKGDIEKAAAEAAKWVTPSGNSPIWKSK